MEIHWIGSSKKDLLAFPRDIIKDIGFQLGFVQNGALPSDSKSMRTVGKGCFEIRAKDADGIYRTVYVTAAEGCIGVLHCFQKKTEKTSQHDIEVARSRLKEFLKERERS